MRNTWKKCAVLIPVIILGLTGCGNKEQSFYGNGDHTYARSEAAKMMTWEVPSLEDIDPGMSRAHFISAPEYEFPVEGVSEYSVDYDLEVAGTSACFALSDGHGEFGQMVLCEVYGPSLGSDEKACFYISISDNGVIKERISECEIDASADGVYHVELQCTKSALAATVNGQNAGKYEQTVALGAIGTYKGRSQSYGFIDNILVKTADSAVLYDEKFESDNNIFDPFFTYVDNGRMRVSSGYTLTEIRGVPAPVFRKEFTFGVDFGQKHKMKDMTSATLYMTALGAFDATINDSRVSPDVLDPGVLDYGNELKHVGYDVTSLIRADNVMEITLAHGWYDRGLGFPETAQPWGDKLALKGELVIEYKDGSFDILPTDDTFKVSYDTCVRFDDIYQGEIYDDNYIDIEKTWQSVEVDAVDEKWISLSITARESEPIREVNELYPQAITEPEPGVFVYDFGRNVSGFVSIDMTGETALGQDGNGRQSVDWEILGATQGDVITFRYGETLNMEGMANIDGAPGTVWTENLLTARATDYYVVGATTSPYISFRYTVHGFRYLEVRGLEEAFPGAYVKVSVLSSDLESTGEFECTDANVQSLYDNAVNSIRSNFLDNPTDCNQRDERLGWAGDAQDASLMACYLFDSSRFYEKYLDALVNRQNSDGAFADTAPSRIGGYGNNCWGDATVVIAWNLYCMYGDREVLEKYYEPCCRWVDYLVANSDNYIRETSEGESYGDHLSEQTTSTSLSDTAWSAHSAELVSKMAYALGDNDGATKYSEIAFKFKAAWRERFIREDGSVEAGLMTEESETGYALGICFGLFEESMMQDAADRLSILADYSGYKFLPGYSGLCYFLPALARYGHADTALKVLKQEGMGSLMNTLACGMTSMPEFLNAYYFDDEGLLHIEGSLNHYAYSSVMTYMYTDVLGIQVDEEKPGFEHFYLRPVGYVNDDGTATGTGGFGDAKGSVKISNGVIEVSRDKDGYHVTVPEGSSATIVMPNGSVEEVGSGRYDFKW